MKQLLIGGNVAYTADASPSAMTAGEIGVFSYPDNTLITAANFATYLGKPFYIAAHSSVGPRISKPIHSIRNFTSTVYAAPVKQVVTISGIALASPASKFDEYVVKVIDVSKGTSPSEDRISASAIGIYGTVANLVDRLVAIINGNTNSVVVASRSTNDLVLTAKTFDDRFRVAVQGKLEAATITYTTPWSPGVGHGPRIVELEKDLLAYEGYRNRIDARYPVPPLQAAAGTNYDVLVLDTLYTAEAKHRMDGLYTRPSTLILAITAGASQKTTLDTILGGLAAPVALAATLPPGP